MTLNVKFKVIFYLLNYWVDYFAIVSACVYVSVCKISNNTEPINLIFGGGLPSGPGRKPFDFDLIIRDRRTFFEWL